jgi:hypothetical protein
MDDSTIRVVATIVSILLILTALLIVWLVVKYNSNDKPSVVISINDLLTAARDAQQLDEFDRLGISTKEIRENIDLSKFDKTRLILYKQWLYDELRRTGRIILIK